VVTTGTFEVAVTVIITIGSTGKFAFVDINTNTRAIDVSIVTVTREASNRIHARRVWISTDCCIIAFVDVNTEIFVSSLLISINTDAFISAIKVAAVRIDWAIIKTRIGALVDIFAGESIAREAVRTGTCERTNRVFTNRIVSANALCALVDVFADLANWTLLEHAKSRFELGADGLFPLANRCHVEASFLEHIRLLWSKVESARDWLVCVDIRHLGGIVACWRAVSDPSGETSGDVEDPSVEHGNFVDTRLLECQKLTTFIGAEICCFVEIS